MKPITQLSSVTITLVVIVFLVNIFIGSQLGEVIANRSQVATITPPGGVANLYYVAPTGNDANPGTLQLPWRTLTKAGATARAGDLVYVRAGTYNETLRPAFSGTPGNLITFKVYPGDECQGTYTKTDCRVKIDGQGIRDSAVDLYPRQYIRIEGFEMLNHKNSTIYMQELDGTTSVGHQIVNNYIHDAHGNNSAGVYSKRGSRDILVENNEIRDVYTAILVGSDGAVLKNNHLWNTGCEGIKSGGNNILIEGNKIHDAYPETNQYVFGCHRDGLDIGSIQNSIIRNNIIWDYTQLYYFPLKDEGGRSIQNVEIYGNVGYTDEYPDNPVSGQAPGIFIDAKRDDSIVRNVNIYSNTFGWVGYGAVWIDTNPATTVSGIKVFDNIFYDSGIDINQESAVTSDYNVFYNVQKPSYEGSHSIVADPQFVNYVRHSAWDFRLKPTSPAINRGSLGSIALPAQFRDILGISRPQPTALDMGAYESAVTTPPAPGGPGGSQPCSININNGNKNNSGLPQTSAPLAPCIQ